MKQRRYGKHDDSSVKLGEASLGDGFVNMSDGPHMYWHVPGAPKYGYVVGIPPISVELAVCELQQLSHQV